jgi:RNA polymerase sigma factor (sigma-70 family)
MDELRKMDWAPRLVRTHERKINAAVAVLEVKLNRQPTAQEIADHLKISLEQFERMAQCVDVPEPVSLSSKRFETGGGKDVRRVDTLRDRQGDIQTRRFEDQDEARDILRVLPHLHRSVVVLYCREGLTMKEVGQAIGFTESRASQIFAEAKRILAAELSWRREHNGDSRQANFEPIRHVRTGLRRAPARGRKIGVSVDGQEYRTLTDAAYALGVSIATVSLAMRKGERVIGGHLVWRLEPAVSAA